MSAIKSRESQVASLKDGIASWDVRLALKEKMLQRQYTALETALGKAKSPGPVALRAAGQPAAGWLVMTYNAVAARSRYAADAVATASPARLLIMLYDRLVRDLVTAEEAAAKGDLTTMSSELVHAQAIVLELRTSLDTTVWDGGPGPRRAVHLPARRARHRERQEGRRPHRLLPLDRRAAARRLAHRGPADGAADGVTGWDEQLDRFEQRLADQRQALTEGRPEDVAAFVPQPAGPLPASLVERARALSAQADALTTELAAATASAARQLQVTTAMQGAQHSTSAYLDQRG